MRWFSLVWPRGVQADALSEYFPQFDRQRMLFERELRRARRYERSLTILVLNVVSTADASRRGNGNHSQTELVNEDDTVRQLKLGELLKAALRETDWLAHIAETGEFVALLPEATHACAEQAVSRIQQLWRPTDSSGLKVGVASFPADALLLDDLIDTARRAQKELTSLLNEHRDETRGAANA